MQRFAEEVSLRQSRSESGYRSTHEVAALQPAARGRKPRGRYDGEDTDTGIATINSRIVGCEDDQKQQDHLPPAPLSHANHIDPACNAMT